MEQMLIYYVKKNKERIGDIKSKRCFGNNKTNLLNTGRIKTINVDLGIMK